MMGESLKKLPPSWVMATVGEVFDVVGGGTPSTETEEYWGGTTPWITSADIEGVRQINVRKYVSDKGIAESTTNKVPARTLLVVTRVGLGKVAISDVPLCFSQDLQGLIQSPELIVPEYALHLLSYQLQFLKFAGQGTTISGVTKKQLKDLAFPLPPTAEQHRVVAKIEELFSELDQGVASLKTAREQLKVYRQSLLKNAFEGKLTAAWRAAHRDQLETAAALQQRIAHERQARHQQQLADWQTAGQQGAKPKPPKPLPPLTAEELAELPELPAGWGWGRLLDACEAVVDCHNKTAPYQAEGIPLVRTPSIRDMRLNFDDSIRYVSQETYAHWSRRCPPLPGDILFTREAPMGEAALIPEGRKVCMGQRIMLLRPGKFLSGKYLLCATQNPFFKKICDKVAVGTGVKHLRVGDVERLVFPICSQLEQQEIADQLDAKLSEADQLDQTLATALQQADALRQSILKKAFCGQLVKQDKNEEPATALLERIRAARCTEKPARRGRSAGSPS